MATAAPPYPRHGLPKRVAGTFGSGGKSWSFAESRSAGSIIAVGPGLAMDKLETVEWAVTLRAFWRACASCRARTSRLSRMSTSHAGVHSTSDVRIHDHPGLAPKIQGATYISSPSKSPVALTRMPSCTVAAIATLIAGMHTWHTSHERSTTTTTTETQTESEHNRKLAFQSEFAELIETVRKFQFCSGLLHRLLPWRVILVALKEYCYHPD